MLGKLDSEIREAEARIARERHLLAGSLHATGDRVREKVISPPALTAFAVAGFIAGDITRRRRPHPAETKKTLKASVGGLLLSGAMALVKARYGSPWNLAGEVLGKVNDRYRGNGADDATGAYRSNGERASDAYRAGGTYRRSEAHRGY